MLRWRSPSGGVIPDADGVEKSQDQQPLQRNLSEQCKGVPGLTAKRGRDVRQLYKRLGRAAGTRRRFVRMEALDRREHVKPLIRCPHVVEIDNPTTKDLLCSLQGAPRIEKELLEKGTGRDWYCPTR